MLFLLFLFSLNSSKNFRLLAHIPPPHAFTYNLPLGDANHNGRGEIYLRWLPDSGYAQNSIWENQGNDIYDSVYNYRYPEDPSGLALGYIDNDSLTDMVADFAINDTGYFGVLESPSYDSFPTQVVWKTEGTLDNILDAYITDLDQDGKKEILLRCHYATNWNTRIYEATGNNQYTLVYDEPPPVEDYVGGMCWGDWDNDGKIEFAFGDCSYCDVFVYENTGDNAYQLVWTGKLPPDTIHYRVNPPDLYKTASDGDMDYDGKGDFVIGGDCGTVYKGSGVRYDIYEATGDNTYQHIQMITYPLETHLDLGYISDVRAGDIDNDGIPEIVLSRFNAIEIWKAIKTHVYRRIGYYHLPTPPGSYWPDIRKGIYDLNNNGYNEIVLSGSNGNSPYRTFVLEYHPYHCDVAPIVIDTPSVILNVRPSRRYKSRTSILRPYPIFSGQKIEKEKNKGIKYIQSEDGGYPVPVYSSSPSDTIFKELTPEPLTDSSIVPVAVAYNYGLDSTDADITLSIHSVDEDTEVYRESVPVSLSSRRGKFVKFPRWIFKEGEVYTINARTSTSGDENPDNDTIIQYTVAVARHLNSPFTENPPKIDGVIDSTEWRDAKKLDISELTGNTPEGAVNVLGGGPNKPGDCYMYIENDSNYLYIGIDGKYDPRLDGYGGYYDQIGIYIDENNDGKWPNYPDSSEGNWWLEEADNSVLYRPVYADSPWVGTAYPVGVWGVISDKSGNVQYEIKIPFGSRNQDLNVEAGDTIGIFVYAYGILFDPIGVYYQDMYGWFPQDITPVGVWYPENYSKVILGKGPAGITEKEKISQPSKGFYAKVLGNPVCDRAVIEFGLPKREDVNLRIYDLTGRLVAEPINKEMDAGIHKIRWNGNASGIYFYMLKAGNKSTTGKIILLK